MLTIRQPQIEAFRQALWSDFVREATESLGIEAVKDLTGLTPAQRRVRIGWALERGRSLGLRGPQSVLDFAATVLRYGPCFDRHPAVKPWRDGPGASVDERWRRLYDGLPQRVWHELELLADDAHWRED